MQVRAVGTAGRVFAGLVALALPVAAATGCGSSGHRAAIIVGGTTTMPSTTPTVSTPIVPTTVAHQLPTVPDCGGGAFKPATLLIVCGTGGTMATGVTWRSWGTATATGSGTVHLQVHGRAATAAATLLLSRVVAGSVGPQFTRLTITWTGMSPDGRPQDTYQLQVQG
jgi:hypothetical protein